MLTSVLLQRSGSIRGQAEIFDEIFLVFLGLGTLVGIVVVSYTLLNAYKFRDDGSEPKESFDPPVLGELPTGKGGPKAKKLFLSFGLSAIIVISLVVYAYGLLLVVEEGPDSADIESDMEVEVVGYQFGWEFQYPNGVTTQDQLYVPQDSAIELRVTSRDVWHNFGVPELRIKTDSIPGDYSETWFTTDEADLSPGEERTYQIECFELCGSGHSYMNGEIVVMHEEDFNDWYDTQAAENENDSEESQNAMNANDAVQEATA
ncbi:cytochrome c oxidase subunit II [Halopenitus sp. H-Gu1]|uniref:cytochrome c oxidase subunit II n=1 Tax=Halopenitus sp. H-Gu1 TaxID=3242697 RepID=UPI00359EB979